MSHRIIFSTWTCRWSQLWFLGTMWWDFKSPCCFPTFSLFTHMSCSHDHLHHSYFISLSFQPSLSAHINVVMIGIKWGLKGRMGLNLNFYWLQKKEKKNPLILSLIHILSTSLVLLVQTQCVRVWLCKVCHESGAINKAINNPLAVRAATKTDAMNCHTWTKTSEAHVGCLWCFPLKSVQRVLRVCGKWAALH